MNTLTKNTPKISFLSAQDDPFARELQSEVKAYFAKAGISDKANWVMILKMVFYFGGFFATFAWILSHPSSNLVTLLLCVAFGFFSCGIGLNIGHDAIHGACFKNRKLNRLFGHSFTLVGANPYNWRILHNVIHHSYTNIVNADGDLHPGPWFRFYASKEGLRPFHRFQHLYALALYSLTSLVWVFKKDFDHIHKPEHYAYKKPALPRFEFEFLILTKALYFITILGLPLWVGGYSVGETILGFLIIHAVQGLNLAIIFQLGHIVEGPQIVHLKENSNSFSSPLRHQLLGTANFAPKNPLVRWTSGGLNYQIEHHMFPLVCHVHYPQLAPIVKKVAFKHGLPYFEYPTMLSALKSHFRLLKAAGVGTTTNTDTTKFYPTKPSSRLSEEPIISQKYQTAEILY